MHASRSAVGYSTDLARRPALDRDAERALLDRIAEGDREARALLIEGHLRFAYQVALKYRRTGTALEDLVSAANLGLVKAADAFDRDRDVRFISYAVWWIRQSIHQALLSETRLVRLPAHRVRDLQAVRDAVRRRENEGVPADSVSDLARETGVPSDFVKAVVSDDFACVSLDAGVGDLDRSRMGDLIPDDGPAPDANLQAEWMVADVEAALAVLDPRSRKILEMHYGLTGEKPLNMAAIGRILKLSKERVRQIRQAALKRLRKRRSTPTLDPYREEVWRIL